MKKHLIVSAAALMLCMAIASSAGAAEQTHPQLEVVGSGIVYAKPDIAVLSFAVESNRPRAADAVVENAQKADTLLKALKKLMDKDDKIQTSGYSVHPVYNKSDRLRPSGYRVSNRVVVETRQVENVGDFIDAAASAGAGSMGSLHFRSSQEAEYLKQAAAQAVGQARETAETLSKAAGVSIKRVRQIRYMPQGRPVGRFMAEAAVARVQTPIEPGELTIEAEVTMVFDIE